MKRPVYIFIYQIAIQPYIYKVSLLLGCTLLLGCYSLTWVLLSYLGVTLFLTWVFTPLLGCYSLTWVFLPSVHVAF